VEQGPNSRRGTPLHVSYDMPVNVQGHRRRGVAQSLTDHMHRFTCGKKEGCAGVP